MNARRLGATTRHQMIAIERSRHERARARERERQGSPRSEIPVASGTERTIGVNLGASSCMAEAEKSEGDQDPKTAENHFLCFLIFAAAVVFRGKNIVVDRFRAENCTLRREYRVSSVKRVYIIDPRSEALTMRFWQSC